MESHGNLAFFATLKPCLDVSAASTIAGKSPLYKPMTDPWCWEKNANMTGVY